MKTLPRQGVQPPFPACVGNFSPLFDCEFIVCPAFGFILAEPVQRKLFLFFPSQNMLFPYGAKQVGHPNRVPVLSYPASVLFPFPTKQLFNRSEAHFLRPAETFNYYA